MSDSAVRNVFGDVLEDHVQKLGLCAKDSFWRRVVEELPVVKLRDVIDEPVSRTLFEPSLRESVRSRPCRTKRVAINRPYNFSSSPSSGVQRATRH